jgi:copper chaperone NosL
MAMPAGRRHTERRLRRTERRRRWFLAVTRAASVLMVLATSSAATAAGPSPVTPTAQDRCPVCGMFTAKYPDFLSQIVYEDGSYVTFDGPKDLFTYLLDRETYSGRRTIEGDAIYVTEYYSLEPIDARTAFFVMGSDVHGPMGHELVPFATRDDAEGFQRDHRGTAVLHFDGVTPEVLADLALKK